MLYSSHHFTSWWWGMKWDYSTWRSYVLHDWLILNCISLYGYWWFCYKLSNHLLLYLQLVFLVLLYCYLLLGRMIGCEKKKILEWDHSILIFGAIHNPWAWTVCLWYLCGNCVIMCAYFYIMTLKTMPCRIIMGFKP